MSTFTLTDSGGLAAGEGIGSAIKAFALAGTARQKAELESGLKTAQIYNYNQAGNHHAANAALLAERLGLVRDPMRAALLENGVPLAQRPAIEDYQQNGGMGPDGMGPPSAPPIDPAKMALVGKALALAHKANMSGSNVQQMANARQDDAKTDAFAAALNGRQDVTRLAQARFGAFGGPAVFDNVSDTGTNINNATGDMSVASQALAQLFGDQQTALAGQRNASAKASEASAISSRASAGNSQASADLTKARLQHLKDKGALPGTSTGEGATDKSFNPDKLRDDIRASYNLEYPIDALAGGARAKGAPSLDAYTDRWLAKFNVDRNKFYNIKSDANKSPSAPVSDAKIESAPISKTERIADRVYQTPKGPMKWTGTGWLPQ